MKYKNPIPELQGLHGIIDSDSHTIQTTDEDYYEFSKETYFAFIDVLGFKKDYYENSLKNPENSIDKENASDKYCELFTAFFKLINKNMSNDTQNYAGQTSDSLYYYTSRQDYLVDFICCFSQFYAYSMSKNVFFRGGIATGGLYCSKPYQFYGQSVINAYLMENEIAKNPLVVIDDKTFEAIKEDPRESFLVLKDDSHKMGRHYLNPFAYFHKDFPLNYDEISVSSDEVYKIIEENIKNFEYDIKNYDKYKFLKNLYISIKGEFKQK